MRKVISTNFLKELIDSDFSIVGTKNDFILLDLIELNKELKQFVRLLQFLKETNSPLHIVVESNHMVTFVNLFFKDAVTKTRIVVQTSISPICNKTGLLLILEDSSGSNKFLFKKAFMNNFFLLNKINTKTEKGFFGFYKIFNDITEIKKLTFLLVLIRTVLT